MVARRAALILGFLVLVGCVAATVHDFCKLARPLRFYTAEIDMLSAESNRQIDYHNSLGEELCGWTP
jgi:hypothetical protein